MLFSNGNPYRGGLPESINLSSEDFTFQVSQTNMDAINHVAKWTVLIYMAADCNLAEYMFDDLMEMKSVGSSENVNVCVLFDGPLLTDSFFARLNRGTSLEDDFIARFSDVWSSDERVLKEIILNSVVLFPAEKKLLILSGHGFGWKGALQDDSTWKQYLDRNAISMPSDDLSKYVHQLDDLVRQSAQELKKRLNPEEECEPFKFDIMALDACYMGNVEALSAWYKHAGILIASENQEFGTGYPYDRILDELKHHPDQDGFKLAEHLVKETKKSYVDSSVSDSDVPLTQVAFDCKRFPDFVNLMENLAKTLSAHISQEGVETIKNCVQSTYTFKGGFIDLKLFALKLLDAKLPAEVKKPVESLLDFFDHSGFVVASEVSDNPYFPKGLSIYLPPPDKFDEKYLEIVNSLPPGLRLWTWFMATYYIGILGKDANKHPLVSAVFQSTVAMTQRKGNL
jgi:hypothetical protein